jgi:hypothetical protein
VTDDARDDVVSRQYERWRYPPPIDDLTAWTAAAETQRLLCSRKTLPDNRIWSDGAAAEYEGPPLLRGLPSRTADIWLTVPLEPVLEVCVSPFGSSSASRGRYVLSDSRFQS